MRLGPSGPWLAGVLLACACDAQVTSDYQGERLVKIRGDVLAAAPVDADAALLWWTPSGAGGGLLATRVATDGRFPPAFTLSVYRQPPDAALIDVGGSDGAELAVPWQANARLACALPPALDLGTGRVAIATIAAVRHGSDDAALAGAVLGLDTDYALVFVASGTRLAPGYHIMRVAEVAPAPGALLCQPCPPGAAVPGGCAGPPLYLSLPESEAGVDGTQIEIRIRAG